MRAAESIRKTKESEIRVSVNLDGNGIYKIETGIKFFNHMLEQFSHHSRFDIEIDAKSLDGDGHHVIEDTSITLGDALLKALGDKKGIKRYGTALVPMDEALSLTVVDISGRPFAKIDAEIKEEKVSDFETILMKHFFSSLASVSKITLHIKLLDGEDTHHEIESIFKSFAQAMKEAVKIVGNEIPSTKGIL